MTDPDTLAAAAPPTDPDALAAAALGLARRFAAGATLWCVAEPWPTHGRHVAVEFVHPVVVGKRALPAFHVEGADIVGAVRLVARPGDALVVVGTAADSLGLLRRAEAWGLTRVWLGAGSPPPAGLAEHVVWHDTPAPDIAARSGDVVLLYHLLWELTHVVFEHPGLLTPEAPCDGPTCITCADQGTVAEIRAVDTSGRAEVLAAGRTETVDVSLVEGAAAGDLVLVHAGVAVATVP